MPALKVVLPSGENIQLQTRTEQEEKLFYERHGTKGSNFLICGGDFS